MTKEFYHLNTDTLLPKGVSFGQHQTAKVGSRQVVYFPATYRLDDGSQIQATVVPGFVTGPDQKNEYDAPYTPVSPVPKAEQEAVVAALSLANRVNFWTE